MRIKIQDKIIISAFSLARNNDININIPNAFNIHGIEFMAKY